MHRRTPIARTRITFASAVSLTSAFPKVTTSHRPSLDSHTSSSSNGSARSFVTIHSTSQSIRVLSVVFASCLRRGSCASFGSVSCRPLLVCEVRTFDHRVTQTDMAAGNGGGEERSDVRGSVTPITFLGARNALPICLDARCSRSVLSFSLYIHTVISRNI